MFFLNLSHESIVSDSLLSRKMFLISVNFKIGFVIGNILLEKIKLILMTMFDMQWLSVKSFPFRIKYFQMFFFWRIRYMQYPISRDQEDYR